MSQPLVGARGTANESARSNLKCVAGEKASMAHPSRRRTYLFPSFLPVFPRLFSLFLPLLFLLPFFSLFSSIFVLFETTTRIDRVVVFLSFLEGKLAAAGISPALPV